MVATLARRPLLFVVLGLMGIAILAYLRPLFLGDTFYLRDHLTLTLPARTYLADSIASGRLPHWWGGIGLGVPFAANPMHGALYPLAWLGALLPMPWAWDLTIVLHVLLMGVGVAFLATRWGADSRGQFFAGAIAMLCGYTSSMVVNGVPMIAMAWLPWVAWAADRAVVGDEDLGPTWRQLVGGGLLLAGLFAALVIAGDPAVSVTGAILVGCVAIARAKSRVRGIVVIVGAGAAAACLAAVVIVPALYLLGDTARASGIGWDEATSWSMHPLRILEWIWPGAAGDSHGYQPQSGAHCRQYWV